MFQTLRLIFVRGIKFCSNYGNWVLYGTCNRRSFKKELFLIILALGSYFYFERRVLSGELTFVNDSIVWYPVFHYFTDSLWSGFLATWNPYLHGGEPFYFVWGLWRLLNPVTLCLILFTKLFTPSLFDLYHFNMIIRIAVCEIGLYFCFRYLFPRFLCSYFVFLAALLFGQWSLVQGGRIEVFEYAPWSMLFLLRMLEGKSKFDLLFFSFFSGLTFGTAVYKWGHLFFFLEVFLLTLIIWKRDCLKRIFCQDFRVILASLFIFLCLSAPLLSLFQRKDDFSFVVRHYMTRGMETEKEEGLLYRFFGVSYAKQLQGKFAGPTCLTWKGWYTLYLPFYPSFFGPIAQTLIVIGIIFGTHRFKYNFLLAGLGTYFITIGSIWPFTPLYRIIYLFSPPLWAIRYPCALDPFTSFCALFFLGSGVLTLFRFFNWAVTLLDAGIELRIRYKRRLLLTYLFFIILISLYIIEYCQRAEILGSLMSAEIFRERPFSHLIFQQGLILQDRAAFLQGCSVNSGCDRDTYNRQATYVQGSAPSEFATQEWRLSNERLYGLGLSMRPFSYAPLLLKKDVALDDILPNNPNPTLIPDALGIKFTQWMYFYWLKYYLPLYEIAEENVELFGKIMGVNEDLFGFYPTVIEADVSRQIDILNGIEIDPVPVLLLNNSFEKWGRQDDCNVPLSWDVLPENECGQIEHQTVNVKNGTKSAVITPVAKGNVALSQRLIVDKRIRGKWVQFSLWVKSANTRKGAITISMRDDVSAYVSKRAYSNSGNWEKLIVTKYVGTETQNLEIRIMVSPQTNAPVVFDNANLTTKGETAIPKLLWMLDRAVLISPELEPGFEILRGASMSSFDELLASLERTSSPTFSYEILSYRPNCIHIRIHAESDGMLLFRDGFTPDWRVFVDDNPRKLYRGNVNFKAVPLKGGVHEVKFVYQPAFFLLALSLYLGTLICFMFFSAWRGVHFIIREKL